MDEFIGKDEIFVKDWLVHQVLEHERKKIVRTSKLNIC